MGFDDDTNYIDTAREHGEAMEFLGLSGWAWFGIALGVGVGVYASVKLNSWIRQRAHDSDTNPDSFNPEHEVILDKVQSAANAYKEEVVGYQVYMRASESALAPEVRDELVRQHGSVRAMPMLTFDGILKGRDFEVLDQVIRELMKRKRWDWRDDIRSSPSTSQLQDVLVKQAEKEAQAIVDLELAKQNGDAAKV